MPIIQCKTCKIDKYWKLSRIKNGNGKFCSWKCYAQSRIGKRHSIESIEKFRKSMMGKMVNGKNPMWKGEKAGYAAKHYWVLNRLGNADKCKNCNIKGRKNGTKWSIHWANISRKYLRDLSDWIALCVLCHKHYDMGKLKI